MKPSILIVDDEEGIRKVLSITLSDAGFAVAAAADAAQALAIIEKSPPEIVLSDIRMPGMDGIGLLSEIKRRWPEIEVIMVTGHGDMDLAVKSLHLNAADFVTKPLSDEHLMVAIRRARERIALKRSLADYTENLERLVDEKTRKLLLSERMAAVGETVAALSHTIRNLAGGLSGGMYVLEKGIELDKREYLDQGFSMIRGNAGRIGKLSLDLLSFAKTAEINYEPADANEPARQAHTALRDRFSRAGVELVFHPLEDSPSVEMDEDGLALCLQNLLDNALEACSEDVAEGRSCKVELAVAREPDGGLCYRVCDTGCGMAPEISRKLLSGFVSTKGAKGTGIGLMLVKNIAERHGGGVSFTTEPGKGSCFLLKIPPAPPERDPAAPPKGDAP